MTPLDRTVSGRLAALALLALIGAPSASHAAAIYTLTDLGPSDASFDSFNASGQVIIGDGPGRTHDGSYYIQSYLDPRLESGNQVYLGVNGQDPTRLIVDIGTPDGGVYGFGVNRSGAVVGSVVVGASDDLGLPFVYTQSGGTQIVPTPYAPSNIHDSAAIAYSINDAGLIVGTANGGPGEFGGTAFLSNGQTSWDLNTLIAPGSGLLLTTAFDINDAGQILGWAYDSQNHLHNYLLTPLATPAPEPSSWLMVASGVLAFGCRRWARGRASSRPK